MLTAADPFPPAIFLMGPTASGKTHLAVEIVSRLPCEIISVDSALIYRDMDIGTAKPGRDVLEKAPHRLIDFLDPAESYSAAQFRADALREMQAVTAQGKIPLLVGGTGLYFRALSRGLSELPSADTAVRAAIEAQAAVHGWQFLHDELASFDPQSAERIHPNDPQRLQRALEVYYLTGQSMTEHFAKNMRQSIPYTVVKFALQIKDRELLHKRIAKRFDQMLKQGLVEEVAALFARGDLNSVMPSMRCVGYRQVWQYLSGESDLSSMRERAIIATRQLAKRQMTWLRNEPDCFAFDAEHCDTNRVIEQIVTYL